MTRAERLFRARFPTMPEPTKLFFVELMVERLGADPTPEQAHEFFEALLDSLAQAYHQDVTRRMS